MIMYDENDIERWPPYQIDIVAIVRWIYENFFAFLGDFDHFVDVMSSWWYVFSIISFTFSTVLLLGFVYAMIRYAQVSEEEQQRLREAEQAYRAAHGAQDENVRWKQILAHVESDNPNDWRLAVIEADIMLDELLDSLGYIGQSIGDKLKGARPEIFRSVQDAWDAHKVRNEIAHRGSDFVLTQRAARTAIAQYEHVFNEFDFI